MQFRSTCTFLSPAKCSISLQCHVEHLDKLGSTKEMHSLGRA